MGWIEIGEVLGFFLLFEIKFYFLALELTKLFKYISPIIFQISDTTHIRVLFVNNSNKINKFYVQLKEIVNKFFEHETLEIGVRNRDESSVIFLRSDPVDFLFSLYIFWSSVVGQFFSLVSDVSYIGVHNKY